MSKKLCTVLLFFLLIILMQGSQCFAATQYTDNVIPTMTSNTSPSGTASASSNWNTMPPFLAFDHSTSFDNAWGSAMGTTSGYLEYDFPSAKCITKYTLVSRNNPNSIGEMPTTWSFQAFNESTNQWDILDSQTSITNWIAGVKKEFTFTNTNNYKKYKLAVVSNGGSNVVLVIGEMEMMETLSAPKNFKATTTNTQVNLNWDAIYGVTGYKVYRSTISGGPYTAITGSVITTTNYTDITNGTTYYYVVSAITSNGEGPKSTEVTSALSNTITASSAILKITMTNGLIKEYDMTGSEMSNFLTWYDNRSNGVGKYYFKITIANDITPFKTRAEYLPYNKICYFEINEYNE